MRTTTASLERAANSLYRRVAHRLSARYHHRLPEALLERALIEARTAAESFGWPLLWFPILAEETVQRVAELADQRPLAFANAA